MRRWTCLFVRLLLAPVSVGLLATHPARAADFSRRPNIVIILADDMGFSDVGCYGGEVQTPNIDRLASEGVRLSQFYNMARCCPTRAALLTGLYSHQAGVGAMCQDLGKPGYQGQLNDRCVTVAETLGQAGYDTAMVGKWHLSHLSVAPGNPPTRDKAVMNYEVDAPISPKGDTRSWPVNRGFDDMWGTIVGVNSFYNPWSLVHNETPVRPPEGFYYTDFITEKSVEFIERSAKRAERKPFFLYVAYTAPHWPIQAREEVIRKYEGVYRKGWEKLREERYDRLVKLGIVRPEWKLAPRETEPKREVVASWDGAKHKEWEVRRMATYAAMIDTMDAGVGRIMRTLDEVGVGDDTLVLFLSDNGACAENVRPEWYDVPSKTRDGRPIRVGNDDETLMAGPEETFMSYGPMWANASNTPFRSFKHYTYEGGISAPFVARWPAGIEKKGAIELEQVGHVIDVTPTCLDAAGVAYPATYEGRAITPVEGRSLLPALRGGSRLEERALFWEHEGNRAVRVGDWKLVASNNQPWELFDLRADRTELHDLAKENPDRVREMSALYDAWANRCGVEPWPVRAKRGQ